MAKPRLDASGQRVVDCVLRGGFRGACLYSLKRRFRRSSLYTSFLHITASCCCCFQRLYRLLLSRSSLDGAWTSERLELVTSGVRACVRELVTSLCLSSCRVNPQSVKRGRQRGLSQSLAPAPVVSALFPRCFDSPVQRNISYGTFES